MKRLVLTLAAAAAVIAPLAAAGAANAQPRGHDDRDHRGGYEREYDRDDYYRRRGDYAPPVRYYAPPVRYYGPPVWRRGAYLPPAFAGYYVTDYGRYGLRPPPRGYRWSRSGNDFLLTAIATGLIFDIVTR